MTADDETAFATPFIALRPATFYTAEPRPRAAIVVRYPGDDRHLQAVMRGLLRRGWELIPPPVGAFEFNDNPASPRASIVLDHRTGTARVAVGSQLVFDGELRLSNDEAGISWEALCHKTGEVLTFVTVGNQPILSQEHVEEVARAGHLVGVVGIARSC
ncbi:MAG: hypothetical protein QM779_11735 [Propionicimonas sp.]|uniref:hypothetical protein n=1 Tax=Propionicimonas sp. TaxID=1955623 RepID=UPI003D14C007